MKKTLLFTAMLFALMPARARSIAPCVFAARFAPLSELPPAGSFPNPTDGPFFLQYDLDQEAEVYVEVFDLLGQVVYTETSTRNPGHQLHPVNLGDHANGVYFIRCTIKAPSGTTTLTSKVTVSH